MPWPSLSRLAQRRVWIHFLLGFSCGLPLPLTDSTLKICLAEKGLDIGTIGLFTLVGLPYNLKFLWAPLLDRFVPPILGRRRGWILILQLLTGLMTCALGFGAERGGLFAVAQLALVLAFFSASQDIVVDAYRTDLLSGTERASGIATYVSGYRVGAQLVGATLALILADQMSWQKVYFLMGALIGLGAFATWKAPEPEQSVAPPSLLQAFVGPYRELFRIRNIGTILAFVVLYKFGDSLVDNLAGVFLLRGVGFSKTEIAAVSKTVGFGATVAGSFVAAWLVTKVSMRSSLLVFGVLQAFANLGWIVLAWSGKNIFVLGGVVFFDSWCNAMGAAAFMAYLMSLCRRSLSATQYALLSSLTSLGKRVVGGAGGYVVTAMGWPFYFVLTFFLIIPPLLLLRRLPMEVTEPEATPGSEATAAPRS